MPTFQLHPCLYLTYVLELENNKYYVGASSNVNVRLAAHWTGNGARWTRMHKPVKIISLHVGDKERELTIATMKTHGWENVRGSAWCQLDMKKAPKEITQI